MMNVDFFKPGTSFLHRFDPRAKLLLLAAVTASLLVPAPVAVSACLLALLVVVIAAAFGPAELWVPLRPILPVLILIALLTPPFQRSGRVLLAVSGFVLVTTGGLLAGLTMIVRFAGLSLAFFAAFRSIELDDLVLALRWFGLPFSACLVVIIAFRSLPSLAATYRSVQDAHKLRSGPLPTGGQRAAPDKGLPAHSHLCAHPGRQGHSRAGDGARVPGIWPRQPAQLLCRAEAGPRSRGGLRDHGSGVRCVPAPGAAGPGLTFFS